jgi:hypothetical protein
MWSESHMYLIAVLILAHHALGSQPASVESGNGGDRTTPDAGLLTACGDRAAGES